MSIGHLHLDDSRASGGVRAATLDFPDGPRQTVWFRGDRPLSTQTGADPFLLATILTWMEAGCDLHVAGSASRRLLAGLTEWQAAWARWRPTRYRIVTITVDEVRDERPASDTAVLAFSGGVDAAYSLLSHTTDAVGWRKADLRSALLVHGFDIPLDRQDAFGRARARAESMLAGTDVTLVTLSTNLRELGMRWEDAFAAAVASALTLLAPEHGVGLIGSSEPYDRLVLPWGSNPATDHLLSSGLIEMRHDGAGASRTDKVRLLAQWPGVDHLRVCWQGEELDRNCGRCEKCVRTRVNFALAGVDNPRCFDGADAPTGPVRLISAGQRSEWAALAAEANAGGSVRVQQEVDSVLKWNGRRDAWRSTRIPDAARRVRRLLRIPSARLRRRSGLGG